MTHAAGRVSISIMSDGQGINDRAAKRALLERNLAEVRRRIAAACLRAGRATEAVELVAVTKGVGAEEVEILAELGVRRMGESRVQEAAGKIPAAPGGIEWHMIGHLQRNKVKKALEIFSAVDSVDSARLAAEISRQAGRTVPILLEVNTGGEEAKHGVPPDGLKALAEEVCALPNLRVEGLMTVAPYTDDIRVCRRCFALLREAAGRLRGMKNERMEMRRLSMGMSHDYEAAVEEGATEVRVGGALFEGIGNQRLQDGG